MSMVLLMKRTVPSPINTVMPPVWPEFNGKLTTTEFLSCYVFDAMVKAAKSGALGEDGKGLAKIRVMLHETDLARAWFEGPVV